MASPVSKVNRVGRYAVTSQLRHFFVTELFRRGVPAPAVQRLAGHGSLTVTQVYADFGADDLRAAVEVCWGNSGATGEGEEPRPSP
jgi:site-specific recombinase XerD